MLKIKLADINVHRGETTFRPLVNASQLLWEVGIRFVTIGTDYDMIWVSQATMANKMKTTEAALTGAYVRLDSYPAVDCIIFDGQDSATMMGMDKFDHPKVKGIMKNTLYADKTHYTKPSPHGRIYWKNDLDLQNIDWCMDEPFNPDKVKLSGMNWLSTMTPNWFKYNDTAKDIDVFAMFSYPGKSNSEFGHYTTGYYDGHRKKCIDELTKLPKNIKVAQLQEGKHVPIDKYYNLMSRSKIVLAPFGYGEMAPRDVESCMVGAVLIKPDMTHIESVPNIYQSGSTYVNCAWDYSDLNGNIENILETWPASQKHFVENMRAAYAKEYNPEKLVIYTHNWLSKLEGYGSV